MKLAPAFAPMSPFLDRAMAGHALGALLANYRDRADVLVLGLPRGGVPVAMELAETLHAPLDVMVVRKLGMPGQPALAIGALASGGIIVITDGILAARESPATLQAEIARQRVELQRCEALYRNDRLPVDVSGRVVILVDDGAMTGAKMRAAIRAVRKFDAKRVVVALPVANSNSFLVLRDEADEVACLLTSADFDSVGGWYQAFEHTTDAEVAARLARVWERNHRTVGTLRRAS